MGARKQLNQILIQNFYVYHEKLKRPEINEERVYQKPKIVGRLSGSNSPPLIWCSWWEMLFPFFVFHSFSILWLSARAKLMSPVSSPAHHTTFIPFIPYIYDYLTFSVKSHVWKTYSPDFKAPFWHFHKKSKIVVIPLFFYKYCMKDVSDHCPWINIHFYKELLDVLW